MGNLSLYREFRPRTFFEVAGQKHITDTLINQIKTGRIGHAYLFTGSRGVGKTTCARIFARAINCLNPNNGSPCYSCEICGKLENASNLDITEIDAASNNGVDDARELRQKVKYPPVHGKYKVFIIDEVHMLSGSAFNALLKTLEEPPAHAVFILATTEAYKLPATILSRVMRFDFRLLPTAEIEEIVASAYKKSGKEFEPEAVKYIATLGEGSARDALSIADRCLSISEGKLKYSDVLELLGAVGLAEIKNLTGFLAQGHVGGALESVDRLIKDGKSAGMITKDLLSYVRNLLIAKAAPGIIDMPKAEKDGLVSAAQEYSVQLLASLIQIFSEIETELRYSLSVRTVIETACVRACKLALHDLSALEERIARLEKFGVAGSGISVNPANNRNLPNNSNAAANSLEKNYEASNAAAKNVVTNINKTGNINNRETGSPTAIGDGKPKEAELPPARALWGKLITHLRTNSLPSVYAIASEIGEVSIEGRMLKIACGRDNYLAVSSDEFIFDLKKPATALGYDNVSFEAVLVDAGADMDNEIKKLKSLIGNTPFKIS